MSIWEYPFTELSEQVLEEASAAADALEPVSYTHLGGPEGQVAAQTAQSDHRLSGPVRKNGDLRQPGRDFRDKGELICS